VSFGEAGLRELLARVAAGKLPLEDALESLRAFPFNDLRDARVDHQRSMRTGVPEVIFGQYKSLEQIDTIARELFERHGFALATRVEHAAGTELAARLPDALYHSRARLLVCGKTEPTTERFAVVCAGTSDLPIAEEAALTLRAFGHDVLLQSDVGVAGLHRLLANLDELSGVRAVIVVAGMEGALPSVVAGLISAPVIAVPTSIGYGVSQGGYSALLTMLGSCAPGIAVVNIDNGFGAAYAAANISRLLSLHNGVAI